MVMHKKVLFWKFLVFCIVSCVGFGALAFFLSNNMLLAIISWSICLFMFLVIISAIKLRFNLDDVDKGLPDIDEVELVIIR